MSYAINPLVAGVNAPPIADVHGWVAGRPLARAPLLDVAQAVPVHPPQKSLREAVAARLVDDGLHRYTPIVGLPELREALAGHMSAAHEAGSAGPQAADAVVTAGCNQAFCAVMQALAGPGDEVLLPLPYYFNHQMWLDMLGIGVRHVPFAPESGGVPELQAFERAMSARTRAIVLVTPNNPTGAVYPPALLDHLFELARRHGVALVIDQTYLDFRPDPGQRAHALFSRADWREHLVQLFSFSKSYALTGFRLGSIIAGPELVDAVTKVQDCTNICAPRISQVMGTLALQTQHEWLLAQAQAMRSRVAALRAAFGDGWHGFELVSAGAWFAYVRHPFRGRSSTEVARELAQTQSVLCVPGDMFGPGQHDFLRFAFANLEPGQIPELMTRLRDCTT